jgi:hypothetical protein
MHSKEDSTPLYGIDSYFTKPEILKHISLVVNGLDEIKDEEVTFVDFACGKNEFAKLLPLKSLSFDFGSICEAYGGMVKDWFTVKDLPSKVIIGLNPPFGYQGCLARRFVNHALSFKPLLLLLILPSKNWNFVGYELIHQEILPSNSFYSPESGKQYKEIGSVFYIFRRCPISHMDIATSIPKSDIATVTRRWLATPHYPFIVLRRVGRNTTKQFYCQTESQICFIENGEVQYDKSWRDTLHSVQSDYFLKIYLRVMVTMEDLIQLCNNIYENPEENYDRKHPHVITTSYVHKMILQWETHIQERERADRSSHCN